MGVSTEIKRKPITTQTNRRNADNHPEFLDTEALLERFSPLIKSIHKRFMAYNGVFLHSEDTYDLYNQIILEFLRLRKNFDPKRGIDFTGFMKFHLQNRVYHWVMKMQKVSQTEHILKVYNDEDETNEYLENNSDLVDTDTQYNLERVEAEASIPWTALTQPQADLFKEFFYNYKSVEDVARERHTTAKVIRQQLTDIENILYNYKEN